MYGARTAFVLIKNGTLTANLEECLSNYVIPFAQFVVFNHYKFRPHVARIVNDYLDEMYIQRLDWPPKSPDLIPIENVCHTLGGCS